MAPALAALGPPDRGRALDPADPRAHRPHRWRPRPVGDHRSPAQIVIHEADAPFLRSRRGHVEEYLERPAAVPERPRRRRGPDQDCGRRPSPGETRADRRCSPAARRLSPGGRRLRSRCTPCRATPPVRSRTCVDGQGDVFVGDAVQIHGAANGFPGYVDPDAYRASLRTCVDHVRPATRLFLGHPYRPADAEPHGVELDRELSRRGASAEPRHRGPRPRGHAAVPRGRSTRPARRTRRSARSPISSATRRIRRSSRPRSSPPSTAIADGSTARRAPQNP